MNTFDWNDTGFEENPDLSFAHVEDTAVRMVLRKMGNASAIQSLRHRCREVTGSDLLTFPWFHEEYPSWPIVFGVARVDWVHKITLNQILKSFTKTPIFKAYEGFIEDVGVNVREESAGLIFRWPGNTSFVLHNHPRDDEYIDKGKEWARITRPMGNMSPRVVYTIEPLDALLHTVDKDD
jgi:hypothetical protein